MQCAKPRQLRRLEVKALAGAFNRLVSCLPSKGKVADMCGIHAGAKSIVYFVEQRSGLTGAGRAGHE